MLTDGLYSLIKIMQILFKNSFIFYFWGFWNTISGPFFPVRKFVSMPMTTHGISTCLGCSLAEAVCSVKADSYVLRSTPWRPWTWEALYLKQLKKRKRDCARFVSTYVNSWGEPQSHSQHVAWEKPLWQYYLRIDVSRISTWLSLPEWSTVEWGCGAWEVRLLGWEE